MPSMSLARLEPRKQRRAPPIPPRIFIHAPPQIAPKGDRVLVKVAEQEVKTRGGILLPTSAQKRPTSGAFFCGLCVFRA